MQRGAPIAPGLAGTHDQQHFGTIERQQADRDAGAGAQRLERLDVLTDPLGHLAAGQRRVAEEQHRLVLVALESADQQMAVMGRIAQQLVTHVARLERVAIQVCRYPPHSRSQLPSLRMAEADVVITGTVLTVDAVRPTADALAVADGRIVALGDWSEVRKLIGSL